MAEIPVEKVTSMFDLQEKGWRQSHSRPFDNKQEAKAEYIKMESIKRDNKNVKGIKLVEYFGEYYVIYKI